MAASIVQKLYLLQVASAPPEMLNVPIVCYLIQTNDGKNILIDSGLPGKEHLPPPLNPNYGKNVVEQLALIGLQPYNIDMLVCTHFDLDHCGQHPAFKGAKFVVQRAHYDHAKVAERFAQSRPFWEIPMERYHFVDGDTELVPGVHLLATDGHTRGHQSVLVCLPESGAVLLAIDAVVNQDNFTPDVNLNPRRDEDEQALRASTRKLIDLAEGEHASLIVFGHDTEQWQTLKKLPDFYA